MAGFDFQETFRIFESEIEHNGGIYRRLKKNKNVYALPTVLPLKYWCETYSIRYCLALSISSLVCYMGMLTVFEAQFLLIRRKY